MVLYDRVWLTEANQMLKKEEAKNKHLVDVFRKTSKEFREVRNIFLFPDLSHV